MTREEGLPNEKMLYSNILTCPGTSAMIMGNKKSPQQGRNKYP